jgi:nucleotide sugar dehydrogenase
VKVTVVGAGKIGLPLACHLALNGAEVTACDVDRRVVDSINESQARFYEPGLQERLSEARRQRRLSASTDTGAAVAGSDVVILLVPGRLTDRLAADLQPLHAAASAVGAAMKPGTMVIVETTVPVGVTRSLLTPLEAGGLKAGDSFDLACSPERVKSSSIFERLPVTPKVIGGFDERAGRRAADFYARYLGSPTIVLESLEAAELTKLAGMAYRDVTIALTNELSRFSEMAGIDFWRVVEAANTDGEAFLLRPGIGVGGHCTPVYPYFLLERDHNPGVSMPVVTNGRLVNESQPAWLLDRLEREFGPVRGRPVLVMGLAFRPGVKEHTMSPTFTINRLLLERGAAVQVHDPMYSHQELGSLGLEPGSLDRQPAHDVLIVQTAHDEYRGLDISVLAGRGLKAVVDGRGMIERRSIEALGVRYIGVGQAAPRGGASQRELPIVRPSLDAAEAFGAAEVVRSGWVAQGPQVAALETEFARFVGAPHACAVSSGTAALHLSLLAVGTGPGDEVVTVSHSFIATANAIRMCGGIPVFVDIEPSTFNIDPGLVEAALTAKTAAILCVHQLGLPCDIGRILEIGRRHGVPVVEDAACAIGSEVLVAGGWERIGRPRGDMACFSFHPRKLLTTGDGGIITTASAELDARVRRLRQHGMQYSRDGDESYAELGFNYRMTDIQAAVGRAQLRKIPDTVEERRRQTGWYRELLGREPGFVLPQEPPWARSNWQSFCVRLPDGANQGAVRRALKSSGIATRPGVMCAHREPAYRDTSLRFPLPNSEFAQDRSIILPLFPGMDRGDVQRVAAALVEACRIA